MLNLKKLIVGVVSLGISTSAFAKTATNNNYYKEENYVLTRNQTKVIDSKTWFDKINISGLFLGEAIFANYNFEDSQNKRFNETDNENASTLCFPRAIVNVDSKLNEWVKAHFTLNFRCACGYGAKNDEWAFTKFMTSRTDEANITVANFNQSPFYSRIGIQYVPYGVYKRHTIPATLTQLLTQTQDSAITVGMITPNGFNTSLFVFNGKKERDGRNKIGNGGIQFGYNYKDNISEINFSADWMYNIAGGVNYIVHQGLSTDKNPINEFGYRDRVSGISLSLKGKRNFVDTTVQYTTALSRFNQNDVQWKNKGAMPGAFLVDAGIAFDTLGKSSRVGGNYQRSYQTVNIRGNNKGRGLPKHRIQADYSIDLLNNLEVGAHLVWDKDFNQGVGGTNRSTLTGLINLSATLG